VWNVELKRLAELLAANEPDLLQALTSCLVGGYQHSEEHIVAVDICFENAGSRFLLNAGSYLLEYQASYRL